MRTTLAVATAVALLAAPAFALDIGDTAPEIAADLWMQGDPVKLADGAGKRVYVVEFWATWCPPCLESIPHLSELQKQYGEKGLTVVGFSNEPAETVTKFMETTTFGYTVAIAADGTNPEFEKTIDGIPHAFVVGRDGKIEWQGHPGQLDKVVPKVLDGTWDREAAKRRGRLRTELEEALYTGDGPTILAAANACLADDPAEMQAIAIVLNVHAKEGQRDEFLAFARTTIEKTQDNADVLNAVAWQLATNADVNWRDLETAGKAAARAVELTERKDADVLDTLARVQYLVGRLADAIDTQKSAVALAPDRKGLAAALTYYEQALKLRDAAR